MLQPADRRRRCLLRHLCEPNWQLNVAMAKEGVAECWPAAPEDKLCIMDCMHMMSPTEPAEAMHCGTHPHHYAVLASKPLFSTALQATKNELRGLLAGGTAQNVATVACLGENGRRTSEMSGRQGR